MPMRHLFIIGVFVPLFTLGNIVKLESPRDTMRTFMQAMDDYSKGLESGSLEEQARIDDAVRTLDLQDIPFVLRKERGREVAKLLKETIDRVIVIDYEKIPENDKGI